MIVVHKKQKRKKDILHGHTVIELKDIRTGKRERIEHDNTFTGALENCLKSNGMWRMSPWENDNWRNISAYQQLLGGIYLFKNTIADDNGVYPHFMPASNVMVGNASFGVGNGSAVTEMGTYNADDSYFTNSALCFVYDWTTGQANDTFQCVCLGSNIGGYIGYGNGKSNVSHPTLKNVFENQNSYAYGINAIDGYDGYHAPWIFSEATVTLTRVQDVFDDNVNLFVSNVEQITIEVPTNQIPANTEKVFKFVDDHKVAVAPRYVLNNTYAKIGIYDIENSTWKWHEAKVGNTHVGTSVDMSGVTITEGGAFNANGINNFFTRFDENEDVDSSVSFVDLDYSMGQFAPNLWMGNGYIYNATGAGKLMKCNGVLTRSYINHMGIVPTKNDTLTLTNRSNQGQSGLARYHNPMYLATVNNLESLITKTSNNAMKITYTITKEDEE